MVLFCTHESEKNWVIFANGNPDISNKEEFSDKTLLALDGSANFLKKRKITPHFILGDFDSIASATKRHFEKKNVPMLIRKDQNKTDLEKALIELKKRKAHSIHIYHASGGRLDHQWHHYILAKKYHHIFSISFTSKVETSFLVRNQKLVLNGKKHQRCSFLPFPSCTITSIGLRYEMHNSKFSLTTSSSISNSILKPNATLKVKGCAICILEKELPYFIETLK